MKPDKITFTHASCTVCGGGVAPAVTFRADGPFCYAFVCLECLKEAIDVMLVGTSPEVKSCRAK